MRMSSVPARVQSVSVYSVSHVYEAGDGRVQALDEVSLSLEHGEFVCLLGPSGCGKSSLLRLIAGLLRPTAGRVDLTPGGVGWMAQRDGLLPWRTVAANVGLPLELRGLARQEVGARADLALTQVGLEAFARYYPHQLSGGMRQRAALARATVHQPALLLLDEPFAHLDELTREELGDSLVRLWATQRPTVLMVTHSALEAVRLAQRVVILSSRPGRVVGEVRPRGVPPRTEDQPTTLAALRQARALLTGGTTGREPAIARTRPRPGQGVALAAQAADG